MTTQQINKLSSSQVWALAGKCALRLYHEYELPLLYATLAGIVTWVLIK